MITVEKDNNKYVRKSQNDFDLQSLLEKTIEQQQDTINKLIPKVGTTNYNKMTVNVFLNDKCKNAMNLTDFVENLNLSLTMFYIQKRWICSGNKNIFIKNLIEMEPTDRPIHCSDQKRLSFYEG